MSRTPINGCRLQGRRALITRAGDYMGPAIAERFRAEGAEVITDSSDAAATADIERIVGAAQPVDVLVANFLCRPVPKPAVDITDAVWDEMFDTMVHPMMRYVRAVLPGMIERGYGKIIAHTSAAALSSIDGLADYTAARAAQNAYLRNVAVEVAPQNVQVNAIAQHFTESARGFAAHLGDAFTEWVKTCPANRTADGWECAEATVFLASDGADFISGVSLPLDGGWSAASP